LYTGVCYHPYLVSQLFADLLCLHLITLLPQVGKKGKGKVKKAQVEKKKIMSRFSPRQKMLRKEKQGEKKIKNKS